VEADGTKELVGVMTDITERKHAQEAAEEASLAKGNLLAEIKRLNDKLKHENTRMSAELEVTQRLQQMMLPRDADMRKIARLDISGFMEPAAEVGGDYYDVISNNGGVTFGIGDVTGHGLESGVIAIMVQTAVRTLLASGHYESQKFFEVLNQVIYDNVHRMNCDRNLTLSLLHYQDKMVTFSGQHEEVLVVRGDGVLERHDTLNLGFPLGLEQNISSLISEAKVPLGLGDVMVVYTDGITEAVNCAGVTYGIERLSAIVKASYEQPAEGIREAVLSSLREYVGEQHLLDDISLLVIKPA
jgi:serine phosphatase RsbU (regulator of sigma subunit)